MTTTETAVNRHFYRCRGCCAISAVEGGRLSYNAKCGLCDCGVEYMGRVGNFGKRLVKDKEVVPCDARCTGALGPNCECPCNGTNHGTNLLITVTYDAGAVPVLTSVAITKEEALDRKKAIDDGIAAAKANLPPDVAEAFASLKKGEWIANSDLWRKATNFSAAIVKARTLKTYGGRLKALEKAKGMFLPTS